MDKKEVSLSNKFINPIVKNVSPKWEEAVINLDIPEMGTLVKDARYYRSSNDSSTTNQAFNIGFNSLQKELDRLNNKIDRDIDKLENKTDSETKKLHNRIDSLVKINTVCIITGVTILVGLIYCYFSYLSQ